MQGEAQGAAQGPAQDRRGPHYLVAVSLKACDPLRRDYPEEAFGWHWVDYQAERPALGAGV